MSHDQVTIKDIARKLNIAASTVSRALKDHPDISPATKKAVHELASRLDYQPNALAMGLRKRRTNTIGVIVPEIVHYFFSSVISGTEDLAYARSFNVIVCQSNEDFRREVLNTQTLLQSRVDGLLVSVTKQTGNFDHFLHVRQKGVPIVFYDRVAEGIEASTVEVDDFNGAYNAVIHLYEQGCRRIVHLAAPDQLSISRERIRGYRKALEVCGLPREDELLIHADNYRSGYEAVKRLIGSGMPFDAVFGVNDMTAIGAMKALKEEGRRIPDDVALVGFSDDPAITELLDVPLTSVYQPGYEMGMQAVEMLLDMIENNTAHTVNKVLPTRLVVRASSQRNKP